MIHLMILMLIGLSTPAEEAAVVRPTRLYQPVGGVITVQVNRPPTYGVITLQLMKPNGEAIGEAVETQPGPADLAELLPELWSQRETVYVQPLVRGRAVGPAVVVQPLLSRMVPVTRPARRADGRAFLEIDRFEPEAIHIGEMGRALDDWNRRTQGLADADEEQAADETDDPPADVPRVFTGFRTYVEADVLMRTSHGEIRIDLTPEHAPNTAWNFQHLAQGGFYDGVGFHRIVPYDREGRPFVIQGGDPTGTGEGGPGYWLPLEASSLEHDLGVISMARDLPPDSAGSQFFICLSREGTSRLDGQYCAFGHAVTGLDTIDAISQVELADPGRGRPAVPPVLHSIEMVPAPPRDPGFGRPDSRVQREVVDTSTEQTPTRVPR